MSVSIQAQGLSKQFILRHNRAASIKTRVMGLLHSRQRETLEPFWALRDVSLSIGRGEQVGLVGRNGSGKSTLLKLIAGIHRPTSGQLLVERGATIGTMIELGIGFHPDLTGTENVYLNAAIHGRSREEIDAMYPKVVAYAGLDRFMDVPLKNYSSGMHMRLGFAVAAHLDPDIMLLDEVFAVGDEEFQKKCIDTMDQFADAGRTTVFVSHSLSAVRRMCRRVCVLDAGQLQFDGDVESGLGEYHKLLLKSSDPAAKPLSNDPAFSPELAALARRLFGEWILDVMTREGLQPHHRVVELGFEPVVGTPCPLLDYVGAERHAYWPAGGSAGPSLEGADFIAAPSVFLHYPLNRIARLISVGLRTLAPGGRFYTTFFEVPPERLFASTPWPGGFVTSSDAIPYHYSFDLIASVVSTFGGSLHRVSGVTHVNGESTVVIVKGQRPAILGAPHAPKS